MRTLAVMVLAAAAGVLAPAAAQAASGFATANLNLRSGPSTQFPAVTVIPNGARVEVHGCVATRNWCDVSWGPARGWASYNYLYVDDRGRRRNVREWRAPVVTFEVNRYWGQHYKGRPFYQQRDRWDRFDRDNRRRNHRY